MQSARRDAVAAAAILAEKALRWDHSKVKEENVEGHFSQSTKERPTSSSSV